MDDGLVILGFFLILIGPIYYFAMSARYRNKNKRHLHERETPVSMSNMQQYDIYQSTAMEQKSSRIKGENSNQVKGTLAAQGKKK
ncbi:MAG: hypothetical protein FWE65_03885 [Eggerthellaceae bacterium]|nr:hypothetical protein [Eggerthellaceae bacterium]